MLLHKVVFICEQEYRKYSHILCSKVVGNKCQVFADKDDLFFSFLFQFVMILVFKLFEFSDALCLEVSAFQVVLWVFSVYYMDGV